MSDYQKPQVDQGQVQLELQLKGNTAVHQKNQSAGGSIFLKKLTNMVSKVLGYELTLTSSSLSHSHTSLVP